MSKVPPLDSTGSGTQVSLTPIKGPFRTGQVPFSAVCTGLRLQGAALHSGPQTPRRMRFTGLQQGGEGDAHLLYLCAFNSHSRADGRIARGEACLTNVWETQGQRDTVGMWGEFES